MDTGAKLSRLFWGGRGAGGGAQKITFVFLADLSRTLGQRCFVVTGQLQPLLCSQQRIHTQQNDILWSFTFDWWSEKLSLVFVNKRFIVISFGRHARTSLPPDPPPTWRTCWTEHDPKLKRLRLDLTCFITTRKILHLDSTRKGYVFIEA